ncbi:cation-translocating P-type ATPase [Cryobacterium algoritolerans]|uniref:Cation-translocating P-type ATPase n=1 Tax=Cryobacterium algoritolerans TaxID=1259184 RepID=A0A4R8WL24_9MICO|nr:cation-translocating P-type ATPase [Cryobacterium algoritolerans]TFC10446.1 cation-translocating P-type ATPase [Cryobacterium algoritolerans]
MTGHGSDFGATTPDDDRALPASGATQPVGLSLEDVRNRVLAGLDNPPPGKSSRTLGQILRGNLFTLFNTVVGGCFLLLLALGQWKDAVFGFAVIANVLIGVVQEFRAKRALDRLTVVHSPTARVLRSGSPADIAVANVVMDDILVLRAGDQIPADATILEASRLEIDESLLTGEVEAVVKRPGDQTLSGSGVVAGSGTARVIRVGANSFAHQVTSEARRFSLVNSELRNALNRIVRWITWALIPLMALVLNGQMKALGGWTTAIESGSWRQGIVSAVASTVSMIPQGLVLITSVAFALSAVKLARNQVLIQELPAVEGLARVDVICLDKTGTLTEGDIAFDATHETAAEDTPEWREVLGWFGADADANATARSLRTQFASSDRLRPLSIVPFSSARKWSAVTFGPDAASGSWVLGAPEMVLGHGSSDDVETLARASELARSGLRTVVLAHAAHTMTPEQAAQEQLPTGLRSVVLVTFREHIRADALQTLTYFREQGVGLRVISGDNPDTVAAVARQVGFDFEGDGYDARDLPANIDLLGAILEDQHVFGRVTPTQKRDMVRALQQRGHVVAMTGDGVNDALALKQADIGVAMGSGSDVTKAVSRLVLLDGKFSHLPDVVAEGRRVIANIELVSKLFLTKTAYAILLALAFGGLLWEFPFLPRQLSAVDGLTIGIPAFFLALLPNQHRYVPGFLRRALGFAVPAGAVIAVVILAVDASARFSVGNNQDAAQTATALAVSIVGLWVLLVLCRPLNGKRRLILTGMYLGLLGCLIVPPVRDFFDFELPSADLLLVCLGAAVPGCLAIEIIDRIRQRRDPR